MAGFHALVIGWQGQPTRDKLLAFAFGIVKMPEQNIRVRRFKIIMRIFHFGAVKHIAIAHTACVRRATIEIKLEPVFHALHIHCQTLQPVSQLARNHLTVNAAHLLKIGKLGNFHAIAPHFPAQPPRAQRRAFPIVFNETDIVQGRVNAQHLQAVEVKLLDIVGRRLQNHLKLIIMLKAVGVFAIAPIRWSARGLHIGRIPWLRPKRAQNRGRMKRARTHFHVIGLQYHTALIGPILLQAQYQVLERVLGNFVCFGHGFFPTRIFPDARDREPCYGAKLTTRSGKSKRRAMAQDSFG